MAVRSAGDQMVPRKAEHDDTANRNSRRVTIAIKQLTTQMSNRMLKVVIESLTETDSSLLDMPVRAFLKLFGDAVGDEGETHKEEIEERELVVESSIELFPDSAEEPNSDLLKPTPAEHTSDSEESTQQADETPRPKEASRSVASVTDNSEGRKLASPMEETETKNAGNLSRSTSGNSSGSAGSGFWEAETGIVKLPSKIVPKTNDSVEERVLGENEIAVSINGTPVMNRNQWALNGSLILKKVPTKKNKKNKQSSRTTEDGPKKLKTASRSDGTKKTSHRNHGNEG